MFYVTLTGKESLSSCDISTFMKDVRREVTEEVYTYLEKTFKSSFDFESETQTVKETVVDTPKKSTVKKRKPKVEKEDS